MVTAVSWSKPGATVCAADVQRQIAACQQRHGFSLRRFEAEAGLPVNCLGKLMGGQQSTVTAERATVLLAACASWDRGDVPPLLPDRLDAAPLLKLLDRLSWADGPTETFDRKDRHLIGSARARGTFTLDVADRLSCHYLGLTLDLVYGPCWDVTDELVLR